ncbi:MAG: tRNA (N6-isopentenyl adenosine(37)-C2)-methylthiotransferase MiaB [Desulfobacterales bacterium]
MEHKLLYIQTFGCQMNASDTQRIQTSLAGLGYGTTDLLERADLIVINTCAIREKAEQKVYSFLGRLAEIKAANPQVCIAVGGCVAQQAGQRIVKRMPHVDIVFGTHALGRLPDLVLAAQGRHHPIVDTRFSQTIEDRIVPLEPGLTSPGPSRFVTIMQGCDNYCTYCVVPHVRGREASRGPETILEEVRVLTAGGVREVTLLGQNVNSYGQKEGILSFTRLLAALNKIPELYRIRFTTSHPKDLSPELIDAFGTLSKLCRHIHLPVQSGSDEILKRMNRRYTRQDYLDKIAQLRVTCPDIAITTDFIVGFPGETESDFEATLDLARQVQFDGLFAFKYSDREGTPASQFKNKLPEALKQERLAKLLAYQDQVNLKRNRSLIGSCQEVLVDGFSKKSGGRHTGGQWSGRTPCNRIVNFPLAAPGASKEALVIGRLLAVKIEDAFVHSLKGAPIHHPTDASGMKGALCHAV